jgi:hypothetical protein
LIPLRGGQCNWCTMTDRQTRLSLSPHVLWSEIANEAVLLDTISGRYYGLNEVGAFVFAGVRENSTLGDVLVRMVDAYDATDEAIWTDLTRFVDELIRLKLVVCQ